MHTNCRPNREGKKPMPAENDIPPTCPDANGVPGKNPNY